MSSEAIRQKFALFYVNGQSWLARYNGYWVRTRSVEAAELFESESEADLAMQSLKQEAKDRLAKAKEHWPVDLWWDVIGGLMSIERVDVITRHGSAEMTVIERDNANMRQVLERIAAEGCLLHDQMTVSTTTFRDVENLVAALKLR